MLRPKEPLCVDTEKLAGVFLQLGERRATLAVSRSIEDLVGVLNHLQVQARAGRAGAVSRSAERLEQIALPLGLTSLVSVARDLKRVSGRNDAAFAAVLARLERIANRSIDIVSQLQAEIS